jgi:hypothetical protein
MRSSNPAAASILKLFLDMPRIVGLFHHNLSFNWHLICQSNYAKAYYR